MAIIINKEIFKDMDEQSGKCLFEVVTYIEMFKNENKQIFFSLSNVVEFFRIRGTPRKIQDLKSAIEFLLHKGIITTDEVITTQYKSILYTISSDVGMYTFYDYEFVYDLYNNLLEDDVGFKCGLVYYYITSKMWRNVDDSFEPISLAYTTIMSQLNIGSRSTLSKYIAFLEYEGYILVDKKVGENGHTHNVFKILK